MSNETGRCDVCEAHIGSGYLCPGCELDRKVAIAELRALKVQDATINGALNFF